MDNLKNIVPLMIQYYSGDPKRIHHFMKVYSFAKAICEEEGITGDVAEIIEVASLVHDIGIKIDGDKYNSPNTNNQELDGPQLSDMLLLNIGYDREVVTRVHYLVAHHRTYDDIDALDYQVLVEAVFLVDAFDEKVDKESIKIVRDTVFKTKAGKKYLTDMFNIKD
ncbi:MAG: phosphohydrolase [Ruminococcus sp.]|nr:phosphohydrolase [Ruminococcus sp.]